ncbi:hypothetical protein [Marinobacterium lutimaris]|uniref:Uncharacterized protein n=1 Tax=Marinobacterium lutimaris TaxID=568106 RepID=A0A1H6BJN9_9GAMM|nr:hypothetical protein [Marinobacterium lutimaris]SEG60874.1 hypothetical protein SAMN05444390_102694 [Marinobacterium lutimaris]
MKARTLLLLSADIAGATAYKEAHSAGDTTPEWLLPFTAFFREAPAVLMGKLALAFIEYDDLPALRVWRVAGDEIIFLAEPRNAAEALGIVEAFAAMVADYNARLADLHGLYLRGGAWAAPIGTQNIEIEILEIPSATEAGEAYKEYVGPDVDSGFRLLKNAPNGHIVLSLKLAAALAAGGCLGQLCIGHVDNQPLRGLFGGKPYPILIAGKGTLDCGALIALEENFIATFARRPQVLRFSS